MSEVVVSFVFAQTVDELWRLIRDFNSLASWLPAVGKSEIEDCLAADQIGAVRRLYLRAGGPPVRERLIALSDLDRACTYSLLEGPLAVRNLIAEIRLYEITETGGTFGRWRAAFDAEESDLTAASAQLKGIFSDGWSNLKKILSSQTPHREDG
jgi:hypothetical protein